MNNLESANASRPNEYGKIGVLIRLLVGLLRKGSTYHVISWISHKSNKLIMSILLANLKSAGLAVHRTKSIASGYRDLKEIDSIIWPCVNSQDSFKS